MSQPVHESSLYTTHSLIFSFLIIKWRQYSFLGGFEDQRGDELTLHLLSLLFLTPLENLYWSLVPGNQSSKQEKIWPAKRLSVCYRPSGQWLHRRNRLTLDTPNSKNLSLCSKTTDMPQTPHCCSDICISHFFPPPPSKFCGLVILPLIKDEQIFIPLQISFHLAMTFFKFLIINSFYNGYQYKSHLKNSLLKIVCLSTSPFIFVNASVYSNWQRNTAHEWNPVSWKKFSTYSTIRHISFRGSQGPQSISMALYPQFSRDALSSINGSISLKSYSKPRLAEANAYSFFSVGNTASAVVKGRPRTGLSGCESWCHHLQMTLGMFLSL